MTAAEHHGQAGPGPVQAVGGQRRGGGLPRLEVLPDGLRVAEIVQLDLAAREHAVQGERRQRPAQRRGTLRRADAPAVAAHALLGAEAEQGDVVRRRVRGAGGGDAVDR